MMQLGGDVEKIEIILDNEGRTARLIDLTMEAGKVFGPDDLGNEILETGDGLANSEWIVKHHKCVPIYYGFEHYNLSVCNLKKIKMKIYKYIF